MNLKERYHAFKEWQKQPYQVKPLSQEEHTCATCGTTFQGNYCPRCGQSAAVGRYSLKTAFLLFLDVWGLGNRGMFRTIRDLLLRPGYMIRDYLGGMQMAYFPPFKMFFLIAALSILVEGGLNIKGENRFKTTVETFEKGLGVPEATSISVDDNATADAEESSGTKMGKKINASFTDFYDFMENHKTLFLLMGLLMLSLPLYLFHRHCPTIPDIKFPEFFVALIYITNMINIVSAVGGFFCVNVVWLELMTYVLAILALKQFSGYSYWRTIVAGVVSFVIFFFAVFMMVIAVFAVIAFAAYM